MGKVNVRVRNIFDAAADSDGATGIDFKGDPGLTKQSFKDECTIANIVKKAEGTGMLPQMIAEDPLYGDFSSVPSYQESLNIVIKAQEQFEGLSAHVRDRFHNDPVKFLEFMGDEKNGDEIVRLGLATPRVASGATDSGVSQGGAGQAGGEPTGVKGGEPKSGSEGGAKL